MLRREFIKLMAAAIVAPVPRVKGHDAPSQQYGDFVMWKDKPSNAEITRVVEECFALQIRQLPLRYPFRRANLVYITKVPNPYRRVWTLGWKYRDKP